MPKPRTVTVLVVDDDPRVRLVSETLLRQAGYRAVCAAGPEEALATLAARDDVRVALVDIVMPRMTGFDLAEEIRRIAPGTRIVFMSGFRSDEFRRPVDEPVVQKPFNAGSLIGAVASVCPRYV